MATIRKGANAQKWISFDKGQANLDEVVAVVSTIKGAQIEKKDGITRIYIPKKRTSSTSSQGVKVWSRGVKVWGGEKLASAKSQKQQSKEKHYCAIMLK